MNEENLTIQLENKIVVIKILPFDTDIDVSELTRIHHHNMIGEILTCSVLLNRVGNLLADMEEHLSQSKLDFEIFMANQKEKKRKELTVEIIDSKGKTKFDKPTLDEVDNAVFITPEYKIKRKNIIRIQKEFAYINSLYWSVKSKDDKLNKLSEKIKPEDFEKEIIEGVINGVMIRSFNKEIK